MQDDSPLAPLTARVERFFAGPGAAWARATGVVAFSGGADSTALAAVLVRRARGTGVPVVAAHLDHGLDPGSAARAAAAEAAARRLGLAFVGERRPAAAGEHRAAGSEAAARRRRYRFLAEVARRHGAAWVATAHHRDDQAETVLLRLLFGSGWEGMAGIAPVADLAPGVALLRPLLAVGRREIEAALAAAGIGWLEDPTNRDLGVPRNAVRHRLLQVIARREATNPEQISERAARVAVTATAARDALARRLPWLVDLSPPPEPPARAVRREKDHHKHGPLPEAGATTSPLAEAFGAPTHQRHGAPHAVVGSATTSPAPSVDLAALAALPPELLPPALALLHRAAGLAYPPPAAAVRELARQLATRAAAAGAAHRPLATDAGRGWSWRQEGRRLVLRRTAVEISAAGFSYKLTVPGVLEIPEAGLAVRVGLEPPAPWMLRGSRRRAALDLPLVPGDRVVVRSRRPGDRLRPLGSAGTRRLKDLLIDRRVPREQRDRLPLLCLGAEGAEIAWVPGVTIADRHRLDPAAAAPVWVAEIVAAPAAAAPPRPPHPAAATGGIGRSGQPLVEAR